MSEDRGVPDGQGASGPEEARQRSSKVVAQHKMRQPSKGQTVWNRLAKEREQKSSVLGRPHADHPVGKQPRKPSPPRLGTGKEKSYVEHRPLRKGWEDPRHNWHRGHGARGWASRPNVGRPQVPSGRSRASPGLRVPRSRRVVAEGKRPGQRQTPDTTKVSRVAEGAEAQLGNAQGRQRQCQAANTPSAVPAGRAW